MVCVSIRPGRLIRRLSAGLLVVFVATAAQADPAAEPRQAPADGIKTLDPRGFYATFGAGVSWPQPVHYEDSQLGPLLPIRGDLQVDPGFASDLGLGYDFGRLRGELTWVHRQAFIQSSSWSAGPFPLAASNDDPQVSSNSAFASLYLDLPVPDSRLVPYVGGGLGYTALNTSKTTLQLGPFLSSVGGGTNGVLGYQAKAGLAYRSSPQSDLFAEVVYQGSPSRSQGSLERNALNSWGCRLGVRYRFGSGLRAARVSATPATP